ncbi:MAG: HD domain-containing protein [Thermodesulfovibrio sp.]|nr:HD domain-containing protein [Thermodesulfovibrio sp.]
MRRTNKVKQRKYINIRDSIHGFISLDPTEQKIIKSYPFQRLRFIHQLGPTMFVYPTANHKRFEHSLGVAHLSTKVIKHLRDLHGLKIRDNDEKIFRIACLLHDIGHAPFSHVSEDTKLFHDGINHEKMTAKIIKETEIGKIIKENYKEEGLKRVIFISTSVGEPQKPIDIYLKDLLMGQAGIDRMDYLIRDSYFLGVMYGRYDLNRLIETMCFDEEKGIYWEEGGIHALEQFLLARYFMFLEVYYHKTRRSLDYHIGELLREFLKEQFNSDKLPIETENFIALNDFNILSWGFNKPKYKEVLLERKFFRKIEIESSDHPTPEELVKWEWLSEKLMENFDISLFHIDRAENAPYKFEKPDILIKKTDKFIPIHEISSLVANLRPLQKIRIYVELNNLEKIEKFVKEFFKVRKG